MVSVDIQIQMKGSVCTAYVWMNLIWYVTSFDIGTNLSFTHAGPQAQDKNRAIRETTDTRKLMNKNKVSTTTQPTDNFCRLNKLPMARYGAHNEWTNARVPS